MAAFQLRAGVQEALCSLGTGSDCKHAKARETKTGAVDRLRPSRFVRDQLPVERSLREVAAHYRHCSTVGFKEEISANGIANMISKLQGEHAIGDDAQLHNAGDVHLPLERLASWARGAGK